MFSNYIFPFCFEHLTHGSDQKLIRYKHSNWMTVSDRNALREIETYVCIMVKIIIPVLLFLLWLLLLCPFQ
jgi:hypothetical protein